MVHYTVFKHMTQSVSFIVSPAESVISKVVHTGCCTNLCRVFRFNSGLGHCEDQARHFCHGFHIILFELLFVQQVLPCLQMYRKRFCTNLDVSKFKVLFGWFVVLGFTAL